MLIIKVKSHTYISMAFFKKWYADWDSNPGPIG